MVQLKPSRRASAPPIPQSTVPKCMIAVSLIIVLPTASAIAERLAGDAGTVSRSCLPVGAQESVSVRWDFSRQQLWTASSHYRNGVWLHNTNTVERSPGTFGWENTWRSYAGHLGTEFWYGEVIGSHWANEYGIPRLIEHSYANDCNLAHWGVRP